MTPNEEIDQMCVDACLGNADGYRGIELSGVDVSDAQGECIALAAEVRRLREEREHLLVCSRAADELEAEVRRLREENARLTAKVDLVARERDKRMAKLARVEALPADLRELKRQMRNGYAEEQARGQAFGDAADMIDEALRGEQ